MQSCQDSVSLSVWRCDPGKGMSSVTSSSWENANAQQCQLATSWYHHVLLSHGMHTLTGLCGAWDAATVSPDATPAPFPALYIPWGCCHSDLAVGCCPPCHPRSSFIQWQVAPGEALVSPGYGTAKITQSAQFLLPCSQIHALGCCAGSLCKTEFHFPSLSVYQ